MPNPTPNDYMQRQPGDPSDFDVVRDPDDIKVQPNKNRERELAAGQDVRQAKWVPATPRNPGFTGRPGDWEKAAVVLEEQVRRENPDWVESAILTEAQKLYLKMVEVKHPDLPREYAALMQTSYAPPRRGLRQNIEAHAVRQVPEWQELEQLLTANPGGRKANRTLPLAIFMRSVLNEGAPEVTAQLERFAGSDLELDWAFLGSHDREENLKHMLDESTVRKQLKGMLERADPDEAVRLNLKVLERMRERHPDLGRYLVVDATPINAWVEQTVPVNEEHEELIVRKTGAKHNYHGSKSDSQGRHRHKKTWMGSKLLVISDLKTGLPLGWRLIGNKREFPYVIPLLLDIKRHAEWLEPEYLIGDSEYDVERLAFDLQAQFGVIPVFPLREQLSNSYDWAATKGVPKCARHSSYMKLIQANDFFPTDDHEWDPDFDRAKQNCKARNRWQCELCAAQGRKLMATTYLRRNARIYTWLPRRGTHRRYATRQALMLRRNSIEQLFSQLKRRGIGNRDHYSCRWASKPEHIQWLCAAALFGMTARRDAHETGLYSESADEAWELKLTKVKPRSQPAVFADAAAEHNLDGDSNDAVEHNLDGDSDDAVEVSLDGDAAAAAEADSVTSGPADSDDDEQVPSTPPVD